MRSATGLSTLSVCWVPHCHGARGVALTFPDGFKLSYSGDARPSRKLVEIGMNSTVLLHEATFDDELQGDAKAKRHSTTSEALGVGLAMKAKRVVLTHFSQRYSKIPVMSDLENKRIILEDTDPSNQDPAAGTDDGPVATLAQQDGGIATENAGTLPTSSESADSPKHAGQVEVIASGKQAAEMKVAVAWDSMRVKVKDIETLEKFTPAFVELYKDANDQPSELEKAERQTKAKEDKAARKDRQKRKREEQPKGS